MHGREVPSRWASKLGGASAGIMKVSIPPYFGASSAIAGAAAARLLERGGSGGRGGEDDFVSVRGGYGEHCDQLSISNGSSGTKSGLIARRPVHGRFPRSS